MLKRIFAMTLVSLFLFSAAAFADEIPDMKGKWVGEATHMASLQWGVMKAKSNENFIIIDNQLGRTFSGHKTWTMEGKTLSERLVGGVAADGEVYIAEEKDGQLHGDIGKDGKTMTLFYVESGAEAKIIEQTYVKTE